MKKARAALAVLACLVVASCAGLRADAQRDRAVLYIGHDGTAEVRYSFDASGEAIPLAENDPNAVFARSRFWSFDRACFEVKGGALHRLSPSCGDAVVRLGWDTVHRDAMYPGIVRLENGGALVFTGYLQPLTADRSSLAPWRAVAPARGIAKHLGRTSTSSIVLDGHEFPHDVSGWVYLGPDRFASHPVAQTLVDDGIAPRIADEMLRVAPRLLETYTHRLGSPLPRRPIFYLIWVNRDGPSESFKADVVPGPVMKMELSGTDWKAPSDETIRRFRKIEAHEFAHFWNLSSKPSPSWIHEGGAEVLSWAVMHAAGYLDDRSLASFVDEAFNECTIIAGDESWRALQGRGGRFPYACGAATQIAAIAILRTSDPSMDAFRFWRGMLAGDFGNEKTMRDLVHRAAADRAAAFDALLGSDRTVVHSLADIVRGAGLSSVPVGMADAGPTLRLTVAKETFFGLMRADCAGSASFRASDRELVTLAVKGCRSFRAGMRVRSIEGIALLAHPIQALRRARSACEAVRRVRVTLENGGNLEVDCDASTPLPRLEALRHFDPAQVAHLLDAR